MHDCCSLTVLSLYFEKQRTLHSQEKTNWILESKQVVILFSANSHLSGLVLRATHCRLDKKHASLSLGMCLCNGGGNYWIGFYIFDIFFHIACNKCIITLIFCCLYFIMSGHRSQLGFLCCESDIQYWNCIYPILILLLPPFRWSQFQWTPSCIFIFLCTHFCQCVFFANDLIITSVSVFVGVNSQYKIVPALNI